jgi:hypothetical protein
MNQSKTCALALLFALIGLIMLTAGNIDENKQDLATQSKAASAAGGKLNPRTQTKLAMNITEMVLYVIALFLCVKCLVTK